MWFVAVIVWIVSIVVAADFAHRKGRSGILWGFVGALMGPLGAILAGLLSPDMEQVNRSLINSGSHKRCINCLEAIPKEASVCKFCTSKILVSDAS